jgi:membrane-associated phospholipid phosphatase
VLSASYACYAFTACFQTLPPRLAEREDASTHGASRLRAMNLWVLRHGSITGNTLPSGHVANSFAIALVLLDTVPFAGAVFLAVASSIAVATTVLRYHYTIDAVLGVAVAILSFLLFGQGAHA